MADQLNEPQQPKKPARAPKPAGHLNRRCRSLRPRWAGAAAERPQQSRRTLRPASNSITQWRDRHSAGKTTRPMLGVPNRHRSRLGVPFG